MVSDDQLRADRLVFYADDVDRIDHELDGFLETSGARCAMLIDESGHLVTRRGESVAHSPESVAALAAASFAATREMARLLGEESFSSLFHQGARESVQIEHVGGRALFTVVFDERSNLGLVRYYARERCGHLEALLREIASRPAGGDGREGLAEDFTSSAAKALDDLF
ncbi:MAG: roadblock/LC7 domain-containing protein [Planctomycetota bacterium]|jgi:predicted regulator of Ras-like GTPase activity (Roadblock/LC7/MglB family)|nr:roadblock/LC7 domain-containing protein [Planctomycetota bacterium]MDP6761720.1 roadblock/LC7 domain-containing protein [Planctomycetota bacterium]MDP6988600.1 roadblock/LC7 domain-containing protein [Planctomycetota bacterium]